MRSLERQVVFVFCMVVVSIIVIANAIGVGLYVSWVLSLALCYSLGRSHELRRKQ